MKNLLFTILMCLLLSMGAQAQVDGGNGKPQGHKIEIVNSNTLEVDEFHGPYVKVLRGDVQFYHDSASMYCDSALFNSHDNTFRAFGRVHITRLVEDGDTVHLWGDSLDYDGRQRLARMRENVVMTKDSMRMVTDNIDYDMEKNVANYFDGGTTYSGQDTLISELAFFYPNTNDLVYNQDVVIRDPKYKMYSDTLTHNVKTRISSFRGPTEVLSDSNYLYSERGWYDHRRDECQLTKNSFLISKQRKLVGDTIMYFRKSQYGEGRSRVEVVDTAQNIRLTGNKARYYEDKQMSLLSDSAVMRYISQRDTLFLHADTIASITDTIFTDTDTTKYHLIKAYPHCKMYRDDIQTMCDSLVYDTHDSVILMYHTPVIWHYENQITANEIVLYTLKNGIETVEMVGDAFVAQRVDNVPRYNQISGKNMVAHLDSNKIKKVEVVSNSKTIYYTTENDTIVTGMNTITSQDMVLYFQDSKIKTIWFYKTPKGAMYPLEGLTKRQSFLDGFVWYDDYRPHSLEQIFSWKNVEAEKISEELFMKEAEDKRLKEEEEAELE